MYILAITSTLEWRNTMHRLPWIAIFGIGPIGFCFMPYNMNVAMGILTVSVLLVYVSMLMD